MRTFPPLVLRCSSERRRKGRASHRFQHPCGTSGRYRDRLYADANYSYGRLRHRHAVGRDAGFDAGLSGIGKPRHGAQAHS